MPNYGTVPQSGLGSGVGPTEIFPGDTMVLFGTNVDGVLTGESPTAPQQSIAITRGMGSTGVPAGIVFQIQAADGTVEILGSNVDTPAQWTLAADAPLYTQASETNGLYADSGNFLFYSALLSAGTGPVIVIAQR
jgi:hypothetical protein